MSEQEGRVPGFVRLCGETYPDDGIFFGLIDGKATLLHISMTRVLAISFATGAREDVVPLTRRWRVRDEIVGFDMRPIDRPDIFFDPLTRQPA